MASDDIQCGGGRCCISKVDDWVARYWRQMLTDSPVPQTTTVQLGQNIFEVSFWNLPSNSFGSIWNLKISLLISNQNIKNHKNLDPIVQLSRVDTTIRLFTGKLWVRWHRKQSDGKLDEYIPKMSYTICCEIDRVGGIIDRTDAFLGCHL